MSDNVRDVLAKLVTAEHVSDSPMKIGKTVGDVNHRRVRAVSRCLEP